MADPQHPDIPALIERAKQHASWLRADGNTPAANCVDELAAALRTLARPAEDEEVREADAMLERSMANQPAEHPASDPRPKLRSLLARVAREKARVECERAGWEAIATTQKAERKRVEQERDEKAQRVDFYCAKLISAEQEAARLREALGKIALTPILHDRARDHEMRQIAERALAAAASWMAQASS